MVCIGRENISHLPPNNRGLGMVFQIYGLFPRLNVGENIAFGLRMSGMPRRERVNEADHVNARRIATEERSIRLSFDDIAAAAPQRVETCNKRIRQVRPDRKSSCLSG